MKVLDSSFLIDYEHGDPDAAAFLQANQEEEFVIPSTLYGEYLLGEVNTAPNPNLLAVRAELDWTDDWTVTKETIDPDGGDRKTPCRGPIWTVSTRRSLGCPGDRRSHRRWRIRFHA